MNSGPAQPARPPSVERMGCPGILFPPKTLPGSENRMPPACFRDLNLDQIVANVTAGREEYDLAPFFHAPLAELDAIAYRQEVARDLEHGALMQAVEAFSGRMRRMRAYLDQAKQGDYPHERQRWFLDSVCLYGEAVERLHGELDSFDLRSRGLRAFRDHLADYLASSAFLGPVGEARRVRGELAAIRYGLLIRDDSVTVRPYGGEADYSIAVAETFEKFRHAAPKDYLTQFPERTGMNHIIAQIVERVALLHPDVFGALEAFCAEHASYLDDTVARFDRELQFYLGYFAHIEPLRRAGLSFCYPQISATSKEIAVRDAFDLALAGKLVDTQAAVVVNDFSLSGPERLLVVTGPNQGGKTTFARMFGQLHYLASLGLPVPGTQARLFLVDRIFTHFEREEDIANLRGKLHDDLFRMRRILEAATANSLIVINEIFSSTTLEDAVKLGRRIMAKISDLDALGVCVTFLTELASFDEKTVSLVGQIDPEDPAARNYKILRAPANGLSYALAIARMHRVTYDQIKERIKP